MILALGFAERIAFTMLVYAPKIVFTSRLPILTSLVLRKSAVSMVTRGLSAQKRTPA